MKPEVQQILDESRALLELSKDMVEETRLMVDVNFEKLAEIEARQIKTHSVGAKKEVLNGK